MARNLGRKYATMDEEERRRFEMKNEEGTDSAQADLDFDDPRREEPREKQGEDADEPRDRSSER